MGFGHESNTTKEQEGTKDDDKPQGTTRTLGQNVTGRGNPRATGPDRIQNVTTNDHKEDNNDNPLVHHDNPLEQLTPEQILAQVDPDFVFPPTLGYEEFLAHQLRLDVTTAIMSYKQNLQEYRNHQIQTNGVSKEIPVLREHTTATSSEEVDEPEKESTLPVGGGQSSRSREAELRVGTGAAALPSVTQLDPVWPDGNVTFDVPPALMETPVKPYFGPVFVHYATCVLKADNSTVLRYFCLGVFKCTASSACQFLARLFCPANTSIGHPARYPKARCSKDPASKLQWIPCTGGICPPPNRTKLKEGEFPCIVTTRQMNQDEKHKRRVTEGSPQTLSYIWPNELRRGILSDLYMYLPHVPGLLDLCTIHWDLVLVQHKMVSVFGALRRSNIYPSTIALLICRLAKEIVRPGTCSWHRRCTFSYLFRSTLCSLVRSKVDERCRDNATQDSQTSVKGWRAILEEKCGRMRSSDDSFHAPHGADGMTFSLRKHGKYDVVSYFQVILSNVLLKSDLDSDLLASHSHGPTIGITWIAAPNGLNTLWITHSLGF